MDYTEKICGSIFDIQRFSIYDGPGIRTTVFLKGCPLNCLWCHNPESKEKHHEIGYDSQKCNGCGSCANSCPAFCHQWKDNEHIFNRKNCSRCGSCALGCYSGALKVIGRVMTAEDVFLEVLKDKVFYYNSGGGMTLSGGEPLYQPNFSYTLLRLAKDAGLHTCFETSGFGDFMNVRKIMKYTDLFLFDIKETDPILHKKFTGISNINILNNLKGIDKEGGHTILRCPVIPGLNDRNDHFEKIGKLAGGLKNVIGIDVMPYHPHGVSKSAQIGKEPLFNLEKLPDDIEISNWITCIKKYTGVKVQRS